MVEATRERARSIELKYAHKKQKAKQVALQTYDQKMDRLRGKHSSAMQEDRERRQGMANSQRAHEAARTVAHAAAQYKPAAAGQSTMHGRLQALATGMGSVEC